MTTVQLEIRPGSIALAAGLGAALLALSAQQPLRAQQALTLTAEQREILSHMRIVQLDDGSGGDCKAIEIHGVNLRLVNGQGTTESANCLGNLIIGYNELRNFNNARTGSHNLVVGTEHNYSSYGGLVVGKKSTISAAYASVSGGTRNVASDVGASVSGGQDNHATGYHGAASGGSENVASGRYAWVGGGGSNFSAPGPEGIGGNTASGDWATVVGGSGNEASGAYAAISAGALNQATGEGSAVTGGSQNVAAHVFSAVVGGCSLVTTADCETLP